MKQPSRQAPRASIALCAVVVLIAVGACSDDGGMSGGSDSPAPDELASSEFAVLDAEDAFAAFEPATLEREADMVAVFENDGSFRRSDRHPHQPGSHLREVLERVALSTDQLQQIRLLLESFRTEARAAIEGLREVNRPIVAAANVERAVIVEALRDGEITREEARQQLDELNQRTRNAIRNNPDNEPFLVALCEARRDLFDGIRAVIADSMQDLWDVWAAGNRSVNC